MSGLCQKEKQWQTKISSLLYFDYSRADAHLYYLLNKLTADRKYLVTRNVFQRDSRSIKEVNTVKDCCQELLSVNAVDAHFSFVPLQKHAAEQDQDLFDEIKAFNSFVLEISTLFLLRSELTGFVVHCKRNLVDSGELVENGHKAIEKSLHSVSVLLSYFGH